MSKTLPPLQGRLWDAALLYLGRFEASTQSVRRLLKRRVERWSRAEQWELDESAEAAIAAVLDKLQRQGAVDDARYAETKALSLFRGGRSGRAIKSYLAMRGIASDLADVALARRADEEGGTGDPDLGAALRYAQKRRLGRFRPATLRAEKRDRDLAALGRAGYSWEIARQVVDGDGEDGAVFDGEE